MIGLKELLSALSTTANMPSVDGFLKKNKIDDTSLRSFLDIVVKNTGADSADLMSMFVVGFEAAMMYGKGKK